MKKPSKSEIEFSLGYRAASIDCDRCLSFYYDFIKIAVYEVVHDQEDINFLLGIYKIIQNRVWDGYSNSKTQEVSDYYERNKYKRRKNDKSNSV